MGQHLDGAGPVDSNSGFRMRYGPAAFIVGWLVTYVAFCVFLTVISVVAEAMAGQPSGGLGLGFLPIALIYGFLPAAVVGVPLGLLTAWPLRRVRNQWVHVAVHAGVTGAVFGLACPLLLGGWNALTVLAPAAVAALSAAVGRASAIKLVEYKTFPLDGGPPAPA